MRRELTRQCASIAFEGTQGILRAFEGFDGTCTHTPLNWRQTQDCLLRLNGPFRMFL